MIFPSVLAVLIDNYLDITFLKFNLIVPSFLVKKIVRFQKEVAVGSYQGRGLFLRHNHLLKGLQDRHALVHLNMANFLERASLRFLFDRIYPVQLVNKDDNVALRYWPGKEQTNFLLTGIVGTCASLDVTSLGRYFWEDLSYFQIDFVRKALVCENEENSILCCQPPLRRGQSNSIGNPNSKQLAGRGFMCLIN